MNRYQYQVKDELMKAFRIDQEIDNMMEQISALSDLATKASQTLSDMPGSPNRNIHKHEDIIVKMIDMQQDLQKKIDSLLDTKQHVANLISQVKDREGRLVLQQRYLQYEKWEEIASDLGYTVRQVFRIHDEALSEIKLPASCQLIS